MDIMYHICRVNIFPIYEFLQSDTRVIPKYESTSHDQMLFQPNGISIKCLKNKGESRLVVDISARVQLSLFL
jgi:hypothetical protein